jgi:hypothetical protein
VIQPYRTLHRRVFLVLTVLLPAVLVGGLHFRHRPLRATAPEDKQFAVVSETTGHWQKEKVRIRLLRTSGEPATWVQLSPAHPLPVPDVLVYWSSQLPDKNVLPADARFIGPLDPAVHYRLPQASGGHIVLYSLPLHRIVDSTPFGIEP